MVWSDNGDEGIVKGVGRTQVFNFSWAHPPSPLSRRCQKSTGRIWMLPHVSRENNMCGGSRYDVLEPSLLRDIDLEEMFLIAGKLVDLFRNASSRCGLPGSRNHVS